MNRNFLSLSIQKKIEKYHENELIRGSFISFVLKILGSGFAFIFNVVLARTMGPSGAGIFFLALTVISIAIIFGRFGLDYTLLKYTAANAALKNWKAVKGVYKNGMRIAFFSSFFATITVFLSAPFLSKFAFNDENLIIPIRIMSLSILPMTFVILYSELLKGLKKISDSQLLISVLIPAISLILIILFKNNTNIHQLIIIYVVSIFFTYVTGHLLWKKATPQLKGIKGDFETKKLLTTSIPLFWVSLLYINDWTNRIFLGIYLTTENVGIYSMAMKMALLTSLIMISVNSIASPKFSELYAQGNHKELSRLAIASANLMTIFSAPALLIFIFFPNIVLSIFGEKFDTGSHALIILSIGQFINVITGSGGQILAMTGREKKLRNNIIFSAIINLILNFILIPIFGLTGAAFATAISWSISTIAITVFVRKDLKLNAFILGNCIFPVHEIEKPAQQTLINSDVDSDRALVI